MCNSLNIIEFNGLPGCGKTSITNKLINELKLNDKVVLSEVDIFKETKPFKKLLELVKSLCDLKSIKLNYALLKLGIQASHKGKSLKNLKNSIKIIRYNFILKNRINRCDFDVICLSEGYIQFIYCIYDGVEFFESSELETILHEINHLHKNLLVINCSISKEEAVERLKERKQAPNSVDLMGEKERIKFMDRRERNMKQISKHIKNTKKVFGVDTSEPIDKNVSGIILIADL